MPQASFAILYTCLFLFMIIYLLAKLKTPDKLDYPGSHSIFKGLRPDIILFCFLAMATIKLTYSIETVVDINLAGARYLYRGTRLIRKGLPSAEMGPLYALWYYLLSLLEQDNIRLYYLNYKTLISFTTLAIYIYLRRIKVTPSISIVASFLYLISGICLTPKLVTHFALLVLFLFLILATFTKSKEGYYCLAGLGILAASFVRPEYFISFILFCLVFLFFILRKLRARSIRPRSVLPKLLLFLFTVSLLLYIFGNPLFGRRIWMAFAQNFSVNYVRWHNIPLNPWYDYQQITRSVFGDTNSIIGAAFSNSREFFRHTLYNGIGYIRNSISILLVESRYITLRSLSRLVRLTEALFFVVTVIYLIKKRPKISRISSSNTINHLGLLVLILFIPPLLSSILVCPRKYYLIIQGAMVIVLCASFISRTITSNAKIRQMRLSTSLLLGVLILSLTPNLVSGFSSQKRLPKLMTIKFIRSLNITERVNIFVVGAGGRYCIYLNDNYNEIRPRIKKGPFNEFIRHHKINMIILSKGLEKDTRFVNDNEFKYFLKDPRSRGFTKLEIPDRENYLFVKDELLN